MDGGADPISLIVSPKTRVEELKSNAALKFDVDETACAEAVGAPGCDVFTEMGCRKARVSLQSPCGGRRRVLTHIEGDASL